MRHPMILACTLIAILLTAPTLAEQVDLRGPARMAGDVVVRTSTYKMQDGTLDMIYGPNTIQCTQNINRTQVFTDTIQEVDAAGLPTKITTQFDKDKQRVELFTDLPGAPPKIDEFDVVAGANIVHVRTRTEDGWELSINKALDPAPTRYAEPRMFYPEKPVKVGHKWEANKDQIGDLMEMAQMKFLTHTGSIKYELKQVKQTPAGPVAVIAFKVNAKGLTDNPPTPGGVQTTYKGTIKGEGTIERNLKTYTDSMTLKVKTEDTNETNAGDYTSSINSARTAEIKLTEQLNPDKNKP